MLGLTVPGHGAVVTDREQFRLQKVTVARMWAVKTALEEYDLEHRRLPAALGELVPKYLADDKYFVDGWNHRLYYAAIGKEFVLLSPGRDGIAAKTNAGDSRALGPDYDSDIVMISGAWARLPWGIGV